MKCPHCLDSFHAQLTEVQIGYGKEGIWYMLFQRCPACDKSILILRLNDPAYNLEQWSRLVHPKDFSRAPLPIEVDDPKLVEDYEEACTVLNDSAKASAALSRRCLQHVLRERAAVKKSDLSSEIQEVLDSNVLPTNIAENLDAVRNIGNFAAHPIKSTSTGEIVDVEPHEAEWNLEVVEQLMDFFYVRPAMAKRKRDELNAKLVAAGKPPLKEGYGYASADSTSDSL